MGAMKTIATQRQGSKVSRLQHYCPAHGGRWTCKDESCDHSGQSTMICPKCRMKANEEDGYVHVDPMINMPYLEEEPMSEEPIQVNTPEIIMEEPPDLSPHEHPCPQHEGLWFCADPLCDADAPEGKPCPDCRSREESNEPVPGPHSHRCRKGNHDHAWTCEEDTCDRERMKYCSTHTTKVLQLLPRVTGPEEQVRQAGEMGKKMAQRKIAEMRAEQAAVTIVEGAQEETVDPQVSEVTPPQEQATMDPAGAVESMTPTNAVCLRPACGRPVKMRGLCDQDSLFIMDCVRAGYVTWQGLEQRGKVLPTSRPSANRLQDPQLQARRAWFLGE